MFKIISYEDKTHPINYGHTIIYIMINTIEARQQNNDQLLIYNKSLPEKLYSLPFSVKYSTSKVHLNSIRYK